MSKKQLFRLFALVAAMMCTLGMQAAVEAYANYTPSNTTLTFYYDNERSTRTGTTYDLNTGYSSPGWYLDGTYTSVTRVVFKSLFVIATPTTTYSWFCDMENLQSITGIAYLNTSEVTNMGWMFGGCSSLKNLDLSSFNTANVTDMRCMFYNCESLMSLDLSHFNTTVVNDMYGMFDHCESLTSLNVSNFNTANVTDMRYMFRNCKLLTSLNVSSFITDNVTSMGDMFSNCCGLTSLDLSNFNTSNVTNMESMFWGCSALTDLDVSSFNTANVTNMGIMFSDCNSLTSLDVSNFNTANVTTMNRMFENCSALTSLDLSSFNTAKVTNMKWMFFDCTNLKTIHVGDDWSTAAVTSSDYMFYYCTKLVGGKGTTYDGNHVDKAYARIDGGSSNPGYFTAPDLLDEALNVEGGNIHFESTGDYPWTVIQEGSRMYAQSGNAGVANSSSVMTATVNAVEGDILKFDFKAWGEGTSTLHDRCSFSINGVEQIAYGEYQNARWETYSVYLPAGECTLEWSYTKDLSVNRPGDYFAVDNVAIICTTLRGDVNGDGEVNISDVTALIDYLLSGDASAINTDAADCNHDNGVSIADVTVLIDYLLSGTWN